MKIKRDNKEFIFAILGVLLFASLFSSFHNPNNLEIKFQKELESSSPTAQVVNFDMVLKQPIKNVNPDFDLILSLAQKSQHNKNMHQKFINDLYNSAKLNIKNDPVSVMHKKQ